MKLKDYIIEQINHRETNPVPYTLPIDVTVSAELDGYYGNRLWRSMIKPYMPIYP